MSSVCVKLFLTPSTSPHLSRHGTTTDPNKQLTRHSKHYSERWRDTRRKRNDMFHIRGKFYLRDTSAPKQFWESNCSHGAQKVNELTSEQQIHQVCFSATRHPKKCQSTTASDFTAMTTKKVLLHFEKFFTWNAVWLLPEIRRVHRQSFPYKSWKTLICDSVRVKVKARVRSRTGDCEQRSPAGELLEMAFKVPDSSRWWFWKNKKKKCTLATCLLYICSINKIKCWLKILAS